MTDEVVDHQTVLELDHPVPSEVSIRSDIVLKVRAKCPSGCDLSGAQITIMAAEETLATRDLVAYHRDDGFNDTEEFAVKVSDEPGSCSWIAVFPRQEINGIVHGEVSLPISFVTKPLGTSLAVWGIPWPVVTGERFSVKVGAKSSGACPLKGATVEFLDDAGALVGRGQLGDAPLEGTTALYWTEVELVAPEKDGIVSWSARFTAAETELPHSEGTAEFSFAAVKSPDHKLTIKIIEKDTEKPIENAQIRLGPFRASTDECGLAELLLPKGTYEIKTWITTHETVPTTVEVTKDVSVLLEGVALPEDDPSARWMM